MSRRATLLALVLLASCASVDWQQPAPELPDSWRDYRLFVSDAAFVLARNEAAAAEAHANVLAVRAAVAERCQDELGRPLVVAMSFDDPLPIPDPEQYTAAISRWYEQVIGLPAPFDFESSAMMGGDGEGIEIDPTLPLHIVAAPIAEADTTLELPRALVDAATFAVIAPTESCIERTVDAMTDIALEAQGVSRLTFHVMTLVAGNPIAEATAKARNQVHSTMAKAWLSVLGADVVEFVDPATVDIPEPGEPPSMAWLEVIGPRSRFTQQEPWFIVGEQSTLDVESLQRSPIVGIVNVYYYSDPREARILHRAGKRFSHLPNKSRLPTRRDADQLDQFYESCRHNGNGAFVYIMGDAEYAAALVAAHALWHQQRPKEEALQLAIDLGVGALEQKLTELFESGR